MPELVRGQPIGLSFMQETGCQMLQEHRAECGAADHASLVAKQVVFLKVVRERLCPLLLPPDRRDHPVTLPGGNAVVAPCFREPMINGDPPVALAILDQTTASALVIGHF